MKNNKLTLLAIATLGMVATVGGVKADELNGNIATHNSGLTTEVEKSTNGEGTVVSDTSGKQPGDLGNATGNQELNKENSGGGSFTTNFEKNGNEIVVNNPNVELDQSNGNGKYQGFTLEYKDINFPDTMEINEGDKVAFQLPKEITFQTNYDFDVHNPDNVVVGKATADNKAGTVTTVFNDYFKNHPLNKQMSLKLDAKWTDAVDSGKPVTVNFNGTLVTTQIGEEKEIGKDELISKWGSQDENDPNTINWTVRLNYARKVLNYVTIIDEMSENQKLVDDYFEAKNVESVDPWIEKGSAMDLIKSISKSDHGFMIKMDRLDRMIYLYYKTKLINAVKDSTNPTNKIELKAEDDGATSSSHAVLVGGRGDAKGENKPEPTYEIPNDFPVVEKPSIDINEIPLMPPAPILDKPYLPIEEIPVLPPAPILEKPELVIEIPEPKQEKPNTPVPNEKPKNEKVRINNRVENHAQNKTENKSEKVSYSYSSPAMLPNTGTEFGSAISLLGLLGFVVGLKLKKKEAE